MIYCIAAQTAAPRMGYLTVIPTCSCFNPNGRSSTSDFPSVTCPADDSNTGYYCNPEGDVFACMDWTFGSNKMMEQEEAFNQRV